jgi:hypothetical protein
MKSLKQFIVESQKTYEFKVKMACDSDDLDMDRFEKAVASFEPLEISKPKSLPYQKSADFANLAATQIQLITVVTKYPTTPDQLRSMISNQCGLSTSNIIVRTPMQETDFENQQKVEPSKDPVLTSEYPASDNQDLVGQKSIERLMKDIETRIYDFAGEKTPKAKTLNDQPTGKMSPVGSHQNVIPDPRSMHKGQK